MEHIKKHLSSLFNSITATLMALLGFTSCSNEEIADMYGTPYATFEIKGTVTTENDAPVENAAVVVKRIFDNTSYPIADTVRTDAKGQYVVNGKIFPSETARVVGFDKSKQLADSVDITLELQKSKNDMWNVGHETGTANLVLKKSEKK